MDTDRQPSPSTGSSSSVFVSLRGAVESKDATPGNNPAETSPHVRTEHGLPVISLLAVVSSPSVLFHITVLLIFFVVLPTLILCLIWLVHVLIYELCFVFLSIGMLLCLCKIVRAAATAATRDTGASDSYPAC